MATKKMLDIQIKKQSRSYLNSLHAILTAANLFEGPIYMLSGMTGMSFKFTVLKNLPPRSVNSYGAWVNENWTAVNRIGIYNEAGADRLRHRTFPLIQKHAIQHIIESIDRGIAVLYWIPEFGVIQGYDLEEKVLFYQKAGGFYESKQMYGTNQEVLLFDNVCKNFSSIWFYQVFGEKVDKDRKEIYIDSLKSAVHDWITEYKSEHAASGRKAYETIIHAMEEQDYDKRGADYILRTYRQSKLEIYQYLNVVAEEFSFLEPVVSMYKDIHEIFKKMSMKESQIKWWKEAMELENSAMRMIDEGIRDVREEPSDMLNIDWFQGEAR
ncbi:MAG: hypothetical protein ACO1OT_08700 [Heyndrickxia sp.]